MIRPLKKMSETMEMDVSMRALQLDFFQPGAINGSMEGKTHLKTVPYAIAVHVLTGRYTVHCQGQTVSLEIGDTAYIPADVEVEFVHYDDPCEHVMRSRWVHFRYSWHGVADY